MAKSPRASITDQIVSAVPADTTRLLLPLSNIGADSIDAAGDSCPGTRGIEVPAKTLFNQSVAVTNSACFHLHANLPGGRFGYIAFHQFPISTGFPTCAASFLIHKYLSLSVFNRFVWQEARRELFHRAESVCRKRFFLQGLPGLGEITRCRNIREG